MLNGIGPACPDTVGKWIGLGPSSLNFVAGKLAEAVQLDGEGETIKIAHDPKLKPPTQITISAWIKPAECTDAWREIYRKEDGKTQLGVRPYTIPTVQDKKVISTLPPFWQDSQS